MLGTFRNAPVKQGRSPSQTNNMGNNSVSPARSCGVLPFRANPNLAAALCNWTGKTTTLDEYPWCPVISMLQSVQGETDPASEQKRQSMLRELAKLGVSWDMTQINAIFDCDGAAPLRWGMYHRCEWNFLACITAIEDDRNDILEWLVTQGCPVNGHVADVAARFGNLGALKILHKYHKMCIGENTLYTAAVCRQLRILDFLVGVSCIRSVRVCAGAAQSGDAALMSWLIARGFQIDQTVASTAARYGNVEVLRILIERRCRIDKSVATAARDSKHGDIVTELAKLGYSPPTPKRSMGRVELVRLLKQSVFL